MWGTRIERSVTALVHALFEAFHPEHITELYYGRWLMEERSKYHAVIEGVRAQGGSHEDAAAAIRHGWQAAGEEASRLGTALHLHAELDANGVPTAVSRELRKEAEQLDAFLRSDFVAALGLQPYRTELAVAWRFEGRAVSAGQIDILYRSRDGDVVMIDFKRVASQHSLQPWASSYGRYGMPPVEEVPDARFWRYSLQMSLYNVMLKQVLHMRTRGCGRVSVFVCLAPPDRLMASIAMTACTCCGCIATARHTNSCVSPISGITRIRSSPTSISV